MHKVSTNKTNSNTRPPIHHTLPTQPQFNPAPTKIKQAHSTNPPRTDHPQAPNARSNTQVKTHQENPEPNSPRTDTTTSSVETPQQHPRQDASSTDAAPSKVQTENNTPEKHPRARACSDDESIRVQELLRKFEKETRIEPKRQIVRQIRKELNLKDRGPIPRKIFRGDDGTIAKLCRDLGYKEKRHQATAIEPKRPSKTRGSPSRDPQKKKTRREKGKGRTKNATRTPARSQSKSRDTAVTQTPNQSIPATTTHPMLQPTSHPPSRHPTTSPPTRVHSQKSKHKTT